MVLALHVVVVILQEGLDNVEQKLAVQVKEENDKESGVQCNEDSDKLQKKLFEFAHNRIPLHLMPYFFTFVFLKNLHLIRQISLYLNEAGGLYLNETTLLYSIETF